MALIAEHFSSPYNTHAASWKKNCFVSWDELQPCRCLLFFFHFFEESAVPPPSCLGNEQPAAIPDVLRGWTLCAAREEQDDGQWPHLLSVLQEARSYSSATQRLALFPPSSSSSSSSSTAATKATPTWCPAVSASCQIHFTFCHGLFLQLSVQLSGRFSG